jgi:hypothetical protein
MKTLLNYKPDNQSIGQYAWFRLEGTSDTYMFYFDPKKQDWLACPDAAKVILTVSSRAQFSFFMLVQKYTKHRGPGELAMLEILRLGSKDKVTYIKQYQMKTGAGLKEAADRVNEFLDDLWMNHGDQAAGRVLTSEA